MCFIAYFLLWIFSLFPCFSKRKTWQTQSYRFSALFDIVRERAMLGQLNKSKFDGRSYFNLCIKPELESPKLRIKTHTIYWVIWIPIPIRTCFYKYLEQVEDHLKKYIAGDVHSKWFHIILKRMKPESIERCAIIIHFILQLFRLQVEYNNITDKMAAIRVLQIALNLGQLEGQLGFKFNLHLENFISNFSDVEYPIQIEVQLGTLKSKSDEISKIWDDTLNNFKKWEL